MAVSPLSEIRGHPFTAMLEADLWECKDRAARNLSATETSMFMKRI